MLEGGEEQSMDCIFCQIVSGQAQASYIYCNAEDAEVHEKIVIDNQIFSVPLCPEQDVFFLMDSPSLV